MGLSNCVHFRAAFGAALKNRPMLNLIVRQSQCRDLNDLTGARVINTYGKARSMGKIRAEAQAVTIPWLYCATKSRYSLLRPHKDVSIDSLQQWPTEPTCGKPDESAVDSADDDVFGCLAGVEAHPTCANMRQRRQMRHKKLESPSPSPGRNSCAATSSSSMRSGSIAPMLRVRSFRMRSWSQVFSHSSFPVTW